MKVLDRLFGKHRETTDTPHIAGELSVEKKYYLIREFEIDFMQDVDKDNRPHGMPYGGFFKITFLDEPDDLIKEWSVSRQKQYDGEIRFYKGMAGMAESAFINISYHKACCVNYEVEFDASQNRKLTTICVCPRVLKIGHEEFEYYGYGE